MSARGRCLPFLWNTRFGKGSGTKIVINKTEWVRWIITGLDDLQSKGEPIPPMRMMEPELKEFFFTLVNREADRIYTEYNVKEVEIVFNTESGTILIGRKKSSIRPPIRTPSVDKITGTGRARDDMGNERICVESDPGTKAEIPDPRCQATGQDLTNDSTSGQSEKSNHDSPCAHGIGKTNSLKRLTRRIFRRRPKEENVKLLSYTRHSIEELPDFRGDDVEEKEEAELTKGSEMSGAPDETRVKKSFWKKIRGRIQKGGSKEKPQERSSLDITKKPSLFKRVKGVFTKKVSGQKTLRSFGEDLDVEFIDSSSNSC